MKIIILHGDDLTRLKLRLKEVLTQAKKNKISVAEIDEKSGLELGETVTSGSLFGGETLYLFRDIERASPKKLKWVFDRSPKLPGTLVIVQEGYFPARILNIVPKDVRIETFKLPKIIYKFLDALYPGNSTNALLILHKLMPNEVPERLMAILGRHFRDLYWASINPASLPYGQDWRNVKLTNQAQKFNQKKLGMMINQIAELDISLKTSTQSFEGLLDQFIVSHLE